METKQRKIAVTHLSLTAVRVGISTFVYRRLVAKVSKGLIPPPFLIRVFYIKERLKPRM